MGEEIRARLRAWFSGEISRQRSSDGISQAELASRLGVSQTAVSHWEAGAAIPRMEHIVQLALEWGVEPYSLLPTMGELEAGAKDPGGEMDKALAKKGHPPEV